MTAILTTMMLTAVVTLVLAMTATLIILVLFEA